MRLNLQTLEEKRKYLTLKFAKDAVKNETMTDLFIENKQMHYNLRQHEKYQIFHANTERKRKSPVIQMQQMLNDDEIKKNCS